MTRASAHDPFTKSYAIDQITDIERLRAVAHRMWEAFSAAHSQAAHAIGALTSDECPECFAYASGDAETGCDQWERWQERVTEGFGAV